jgi:hypothetical protein
MKNRAGVPNGAVFHFNSLFSVASPLVASSLFRGMGGAMFPTAPLPDSWARARANGRWAWALGGMHHRTNSGRQIGAFISLLLIHMVRSSPGVTSRSLFFPFFSEREQERFVAARGFALGK